MPITIVRGKDMHGLSRNELEALVSRYERVTITGRAQGLYVPPSRITVGMLLCRRRLDGKEEDMRTIRWLVVAAAAALLVNAGTATAAPPDFWAAVKLCEAQGSVRILVSGSFLRCFFDPGGLSEPEVRAARALCESAYNGRFFFVPDSDYVCVAP